MNAELVEELNELIDNGAGMLEVFEYIQDNTDEDPAIYISALMQLSLGNRVTPIPLYKH